MWRMADAPISRDVEAPPRVRAAVDHLLRTVGERATCERLQLSRVTVTRIGAGYAVRRGSLIAAASMIGLGDDVRELFALEGARGAARG